MPKQRTIQLGIFAACLLGYVWLGYFTERTDFIQVFSTYTFLFGIYLVILYNSNFSDNFRVIIGAALLLRVSLLLMTPNLSDDYFRFIWDGQLVANGNNPYLITPSALISSAQTIPGITQALFEQLNSPTYYSVYPPICQFIFGLSAKINGSNVLGNVILIRFFILLAEFGTITLLHRLTRIFKLPQTLVLIYAFNPLVIIELTGNLHFEAIMIFFLLLAVYLLVKERPFLSAISFALAVGTKLIPIIFLPLLIKRLGKRKSAYYFMIVGVTILLFSTPFLSVQSISNYFSSLGLYFQAFEFNASIYYAVRWVGAQMASDSIVNISIVLLPILSLVTIAIVAVRERMVDWQSLFTSMLFCLTAYLLFSTNVHPWNIAPLVVLAVFSGYRYVIPWSFLVMLTYVTYQTLPYSENLWFVAIEYLTVGGWMVYELRAKLFRLFRR